VTLRVAEILRRYSAQLAATRTQLRAQLAAAPDGARTADLTDAYLDGLMSIAADTDEERVTIDLDAANAAIDLELLPKPGSRLAAFVAAQQPSTFALMASMPATRADDAPGILLAGRLVGGPYRAGLLDAAGKLFAAPAMIAAIDKLAQSSTGEVAATWQVAADGLATAYVFGVIRAADANAAITTLVHALAGQSFTVNGVTSSYLSLPSFAYHGVELSGYSTAFETAPTAAGAAAARAMPTAMTSYLGVAGDRAIAVAGTHSAEDIARVIDAVQGKAPTYVPPPAVTQLLADARTRKESMIVVLDLAALRSLMPGAARPAAGDGIPTMAPSLIGLGFADHAAHLRITVPAASVAAMLAR
jgi:hypothetical protein